MTITRPTDVRLTDKYELDAGKVFMTGLQALVRIPIQQMRSDRRTGLRTAAFLSGYEGSPLAGFDLELARHTDLLTGLDIVVSPAVNEELAVNAVQGSQLAVGRPDARVEGVTGIWYGKAPGLDRSSDAFRHANLGGAAPRGGAIALVGDDSIAKSSTVPSSSEAAMAQLGLVVLAPADSQEIIRFGLHGIALSRFSGLWSGLKLATNIVDGGSTVDLSTLWTEPTMPSRVVDGREYVHEVSAQFLQPKLGELEESFATVRPELAGRYIAANGLNSVTGDPEARLGIVAAGATYLDVLHALRRSGLDPQALDRSGVRLLKLGAISPIERDLVVEFTRGLSQVLVVEEKNPVIEAAVTGVLYNQPDRPEVYGRRDGSGRPLFRSHGDLPPEYIAAAITPYLREHARFELRVREGEGPSGSRPSRIQLPLITRPPYFCSGCPHNTSTTAVPEGSTVAGGIGCAGLVLTMPSEVVGDVIGFTQMGGEGAAWIGASPFLADKHLIQNIGDGTLHHSGSLAIRAAIAAEVDITYKILYNGTVAMTGGQDPVGQMSVPAMLTTLHAEGVRRTIITTDDPRSYRGVRLPANVEVWHRDRILEAQTELAKVSGVTVLLHDQACATELRRDRKRGRAATPAKRIFINERVCEGCGDCGRKSNCMSVVPVETDLGRKTQINQSTCNYDFSCLAGDCPAFVEVTPTQRPAAVAAPTLELADIPSPRASALTGDFTVRIAGIGGTGIVTMSQVLAVAATIGGLECRTLDQLGMAQKGGAVVADLRFSSSTISHPNKVGPSECDLLLACDILVATDPKNLTAVRSGSSAVTSTRLVPTGTMIADVDAAQPDLAQLRDRITEAVGSGESFFADPAAISESHLGSEQFANIVMIGIAVQLGALPLAPELLEEALTLNGTAVAQNIQAFRLGRLLVEDPQAVVPTTDDVPPEVSAAVRQALPGAPQTLLDLVCSRHRDLVDYQSRSYADDYLERVAHLHRQELEHGGSGAISEAFARYLYKLMAYKDEYEVARLSLLPSLRDDVDQTFGAKARTRLLFHPPLLRTMGLRRKLRLGPAAMPALYLLRSARRLRGSVLDPFRFGEVRRTERLLPAEYENALTSALPSCREHPDVVAEIAALPDRIRGYEHVKLANVERYRDEMDALLAGLRTS